MIKLANAPCSWGVLEFDLEGKVAPYGQVLEEMRATGYQGTELGDWGFLPTQPNHLSTNLSKYKLRSKVEIKDLSSDYVIGIINLEKFNTILSGTNHI